MGSDGLQALGSQCSLSRLCLGPALFQRGCWAVPAAPGCAEPVLTLQGHVLAQDMLPIKFSGVKHYSCWQLWAGALSLAELRVEHSSEMDFAHRLG